MHIPIKKYFFQEPRTDDISQEASMLAQPVSSMAKRVTTTKGKILLILVLLVSVIKTLAPTLADLIPDIILAKLYYILFSQVYEVKALALLFPEQTKLPS